MKKITKFASKTIQVLLPGERQPRAIAAGEAVGMASHLRQQQRWHHLLALARQVAAQVPRYTDAWLLVFEACHQLGNFTELQQAAESCRQHHPRWVPALVSLATALRLQQQHDAALPLLEKALKLEPSNAAVLNHLGILQKETGNLPEALHTFNRCLAIKPDFFEVYWNRSDLLAESQPQDIDAMEKLLASSRLASINRARLHYAIARAYEFQGDYAKQFSHIESGAQAKAATFEYDHGAEIRQITTIKDHFSPAFFQAGRTTDANGSIPVFICGLPRSGTTLVEQILSSHEQVTAGDELLDLQAATARQLETMDCKNPFPEWAQTLSDNQWQAIGRRYMQTTKSLQKTLFFTDKNLFNYKAIGVIWRALPQAKIILCQRDAMDTLWGCYRQLFGDGLFFTYSQQHLADTWNAFNELAHYWQEQLSSNLLTVNYEQLVKNQQQETKRLLDFVGLPWSDRCLDFHKNNRAVRTVSATQVRQPLSQKRIGQWRQFEEQLKPMLDRLKQT